MSNDLGHILPSLEPPPGGQARLLSRVRARRARGRGWAAVALAAACLLGFLLRPSGVVQLPALATTDPVMLALAGAAEPARLVDTAGAAARVSTGRDDVVYYRVVTLSP